MSDSAGRHHRPALFDDLTDMIDAAGGVDPSAHSEVAAATAAVLVQAGRAPGDGLTDAGDDDRFVALADRVGLDTLRELWRDADPVSLPGVLWTLYLLRHWCRSDSGDATRLWRAGEALAPADAVVAGVADYADDDAVRVFADAVLTGVYRGDLDVALERAAAFFRVVAAGRRATAPDGEAANDRSARNERAAAALDTAAQHWRSGTLA